MSEQVQQAIDGLQAEIAETRSEVARISSLVADLISKINDANEAEDADAIAEATAELDAVNSQLQAIGAPVVSEAQTGD